MSKSVVAGAGGVVSGVCGLIVLIMALTGALDGPPGAPATPSSSTDSNLPQYLQDEQAHGYEIDNNTKVTVINMGKDWVDVAMFCSHGTRIWIDGKDGSMTSQPDPTCPQS